MLHLPLFRAHALVFIKLFLNFLNYQLYSLQSSLSDNSTLRLFKKNQYRILNILILQKKYKHAPFSKLPTNSECRTPGFIAFNLTARHFFDVIKKQKESGGF